jgi:hypothetical protein
MKYLGILLAIVLAYFGYRYFSGQSKPAVADVERELTGYLKTGKGDCDVTHLSDVSVGDFSSQFDGWPVYASHEETCRDGDTSTTYTGLNDAERKVAVAFVRYGAAEKLELFVPQFFQNAQQQMSQEMQQQMQSALDNAKTN